MKKLGDTDFVLIYGTTPAVSRAFKLQEHAEEEAVKLSAPSSFGGEVVVLERSADRLKVREIGRARGGRFFRKGRSFGWFLAGAAVGYGAAKAQQHPDKTREIASSARDRARQGFDAVRARVGRAGGQQGGKSAHEYGVRAAAEVIRKQGQARYESNLEKLRKVVRDQWDREYLAGYMQAGGFGPPPGHAAGTAVLRGWIHYGDATHLPMQTVAFEGSKASLDKVLREGRREGRPARFQADEGHAAGVSYKTNDPRGWGGDPKRGAALGRPTLKGPADFSGKLTLQRVRLDSGGYDPNGTYFGTGAPLFWYASDDGEIDAVLRASDREAAKRKVSALYPKARFYR